MWDGSPAMEKWSLGSHQRKERRERVEETKQQKERERQQETERKVLASDQGLGASLGRITICPLIPRLQKWRAESQTYKSYPRFQHRLLDRKRHRTVRHEMAQTPAQGLFGKKPCRGEYPVKARTLLLLTDLE
jgi:hypothetical protein